MNTEYITHYSACLERDMHMLVYGHTGVPVLAIPTQDGQCNNWEGFGIPEVISDFIDSGRIQLFCIDTVDLESWSDNYGDKEHRAWIQEQYFYYVVNEAIPHIMYMNGTGELPIVTGFSLGATHAGILFLRRPELFRGVIALSGCYSTDYFFDGWMNSTLYNNSPIHFLPNMPEDHPFISLYNDKKMVFCVGQGAWENECLDTTRELGRIFSRKGIHAWVDLWGYDVNHDWDWWKKQLRYFLPMMI